jgi:ABC-type nitrate/sulfonate/bicarbonate transport system permease component
MKRLARKKNSTKGKVTSSSITRIADLRIRIITIIVLLVLWELFSRLGVISMLALPRPTHLLSVLWELARFGFPKDITVWIHIKATIWRILQGYLLAAVVAIPAGLIIGRIYLLERAANPIVTFARSIATISLLPLAIAWFGVSELSRVLLIMYGAFWAILTNTIQGVKSVDVTFINVGKMFGTNKTQLFFRVILPATLPRIFAGMKVALGISFMVIIGVEMIGTVKGLGALIQQARYFYKSDVAIAGTIFIGIFGLLISIILDWLEKIMLPWAVGLEEVKR